MHNSLNKASANGSKCGNQTLFVVCVNIPVLSVNPIQTGAHFMQLRVIWHAPQAQGNFMCDIGDGRLIGDDCFVAFSSTRETRTFVENREHNVADDLGKHYA